MRLFVSNVSLADILFLPITSIHVSHNTSAELDHGGHKFAHVDTKTIPQTGRSEQSFFKFIERSYPFILLTVHSYKSAAHSFFISATISTLSFFKNLTFFEVEVVFFLCFSGIFCFNRSFHVDVGRIRTNCSWA